MVTIKEQIRIPDGQSFRLLRWNENLRDVELVLSAYHGISIAGEGAHWHYHPAFELTLFTSGEGTRFVGDQIHPFEQGDLVLLGANLPHYWHVRGPTSGLSIQWDFPASHPCWSFPEAAVLLPLIKAAARGIQFSGATAKALATQLLRLATLSGLHRLSSLFDILGTAAQAPACDQELLSLNSFSFSADSRHHDAMQAAIQFIVAHFRSEIRLQQLLAVTRLSKPTFSRQFKKHSGKSVREFLRQIRFDAVCHELATTHLPIVEVALECGFSQISVFNRLFRRMQGCSPSAYRDQQQRQRLRTTQFAG